MSEHRWDPERYLTYADERGRPFVELLARVPGTQVDRVVDLGCGPGNLTRLLKDRWPAADVLGVDTSAEMVEAAREHSALGLRFEVADLREWRADPRIDVLVSNATLQWVPDHLDLLPRLLEQVVPGGWFAFQVPGSFEEPSHRLLEELAAEDRYHQYVAHAARPAAHGPRVYLDTLRDLGCEVDAWETTYLHVLHGEDPVFTWVSGTAARPVLQALPDGLRQELEERYKRRLADAYPSGPHGTVLPFRRVFVVARTPTPTRRSRG